MRIKLLLLITLLATIPVFAQNSGLRGVVVDARSGQPLAGATVILEGQDISVVTGPNGDFRISTASPGTDNLLILCAGYDDWSFHFGSASRSLFRCGVYSGIQACR